MSNTIFDDIVNGKIKSWKIWEDANYLAFLTPYPNTLGSTVVVPKTNVGDDILNLSDIEYSNLLLAVKKVSQLLKDKLNVKRVALVIEGTGIAYAHIKLYPLHGALSSQTDVWSNHQEFYPNYIGYLSTAEGPKAPEADLDKMQQQICNTTNYIGDIA